MNRLPPDDTDKPTSRLNGDSSHNGHAHEDHDLPAWNSWAVRRARKRIGPHLARHFDAEDAVQTAWTDFVAERNPKPHTANGGIERLRWLVEMAIRRTARRHASTHEIVEVPEVDPTVQADAQARDASARALEEWKRLVCSALADLTLAHREALVLRNLIGVSWETTAFVLGTSNINAAQAVHARALRTLGQNLRASRFAAKYLRRVP